MRKSKKPLWLLAMPVLISRQLVQANQPANAK
jgi:hypothetical protein